MMNLVDFLSQLGGKIMIKSLDGDVLFKGNVGDLYAGNQIDVDYFLSDDLTIKDFAVYEAYASSVGSYIVIDVEFA